VGLFLGGLISLKNTISNQHPTISPPKNEPKNFMNRKSSEKAHPKISSSGNKLIGL
jgi:hypothetical protein